MLKRIALFIGLLIASHTVAGQDREKLFGVWRLVSFESELQTTGERRSVFGKNPNGYLIFTPQGRMMGRPPGQIKNAQNYFEQ